MEDIEHLDITVPDCDQNKEAWDINPKVLLDGAVESKKLPQRQPQISVPMFEGIWGKIRQALVENITDLVALLMDNAWFSKLTADINSTGKKLTLKAPTKFIKDWIQNHYLRLIDQICSNQN